jgi:hypothetical protein
MDPNDRIQGSADPACAKTPASATNGGRGQDQEQFSFYCKHGRAVGYAGAHPGLWGLQVAQGSKPQSESSGYLSSKLAQCSPPWQGEKAEKVAWQRR